MYRHHCAFSLLPTSCNHSSSWLSISAFSINVNFNRSVDMVRGKSAVLDAMMCMYLQAFLLQYV